MFCRECCEESAKDLPGDSGTKLPGKGLTKEDVGPFFCPVCKTVKGLPQGEIGIQVKNSTEKTQEKDLDELRDMIENCASKVAFLSDFLCQGQANPNLSDNGRSGFYHVLMNIEQDLNFAVDQISERQQKGIIIEKSGGGLS